MRSGTNEVKWWAHQDSNLGPRGYELEKGFLSFCFRHDGCQYFLHLTIFILLISEPNAHISMTCYIWHIICRRTINNLNGIKMKKFILLYSLSIALFSASVNATILYENALAGASGGNNSFSASGTLGAENFTLLEDSSITNISFNAYHVRTGVNPTDIDWVIYDDNLNMPGSVLASGNSTSYTTSVVDVSGPYDLLDYIIDISSLSLSAGDYWVAFSPNGGTAFDPHWSWTSGDGLSAISHDGGTSWSTPYPGTNLAFRIEGEAASVPEPASIALLGLGLAGIGFARKKKQI